MKNVYLNFLNLDYRLKNHSPPSVTNFLSFYFDISSFMSSVRPSGSIQTYSSVTKKLFFRSSSGVLNTTHFCIEQSTNRKIVIVYLQMNCSFNHNMLLASLLSIIFEHFSKAKQIMKT